MDSPTEEEGVLDSEAVEEEEWFRGILDDNQTLGMALKALAFHASNAMLICERESALSAVRWGIIKGIAQLILDQDHQIKDKVDLLVLSHLQRELGTWPLWNQGLTGIQKRLNRN